MNDRFKFRVWDKYTNETPAEQMQFLCFNGCLVDSDGCHHSTDDYIIEQCTGLKDKNGNLIYEGDIVKYSFGSKGIVRFGKYTGCFACGWENIYQDLTGWYLDDYYEPDECGRLRINFDDSHSPITEEDDGDFEIIGNIHEQEEQKDVK